MKTNNPNIPQIQFVKNDDQLNEVCRFRYKTYIEELGTTYGQISLEGGMLKDELDEFGLTLFVKNGDAIIATARMNMGCHSDFDEYWYECYNLKDFPDIQKVCLVSKMMIAQEWRKTSLSFQILAQIYRSCKEHGMHFIFLDCVPPLIRIYEKAGLRRYKDNAPEDKNLKYYVPMVGVVEDVEYLKMCQSPFYEVAKHLPSDPASPNWFKNYCPYGIGHTYEPLLPIHWLWEAIGAGTSPIPLFDDLHEEQIKELLPQCTFLNCKKDEHIIYQGDTGDEMYIIVEGTFEMHHIVDEVYVPLKQLHKGDLLGTISMNLTTPRQEGYRALTDATVMTITASLWRSLAKKNKAIFNILNHNLKQVLKQQAQLL